MNLEMKVGQTQAGLYTIYYAHKEAPLDVQEAAFAANGLDIVSPAQLGFLRAKEGKGAFNPYSRTNADVFYDDVTDKAVIVPSGAISRIVGVANLAGAHTEGREYLIPKDHSELVYAMVGEMLKKGTAFAVEHEEISVRTSEFGENELTSRLFSDERLGIKAQDYGDFLNSQGKTKQIFFFYKKDYIKSQRDPCLNRLWVWSPGDGFGVCGSSRYLGGSDGAFGVRFEKTAEGVPKK